MTKSEDWRLFLPMYAIIRTGGRQFRAEPGKTIDVEKIAAEAGKAIQLAEVLMIVPDNGDPLIGMPLVDGAVVSATILEHYRAEKILIWKYRPGLRYRRRRGHRQTYTRLRIDEIDARNASVSAAKKSAPKKTTKAKPSEKAAPVEASEAQSTPLAMKGAQAITSKGRDELIIIEGLGPKSQEALYAAGVTTFAQVASMTPEELYRVVKTEGGVHIVGDATQTWPRQAQYMVDGDVDGLKEYQDKLTGGRE